MDAALVLVSGCETVVLSKVNNPIVSVESYISDASALN